MMERTAKELRDLKPKGGIATKPLTVTAKYLTAVWEVRITAQLINRFLKHEGYKDDKDRITESGKRFLVYSQQSSGIRGYKPFIYAKASLSTHLIKDIGPTRLLSM